MSKNKFPWLSTVLYVLAALFLVYAFWSVSFSAKTIGDMMAQGRLVFKGSEYEIINFYMTNVAQYFVYAVVLFVLGRITFFFTYDEDDESDEIVELIEKFDDDSEEG